MQNDHEERNWHGSFFRKFRFWVRHKECHSAAAVVLFQYNVLGGLQLCEAACVLGVCCIAPPCARIPGGCGAFPSVFHTPLLLAFFVYFQGQTPRALALRRLLCRWADGSLCLHAPHTREKQCAWWG
jgi:hypothetical protein